MTFAAQASGDYNGVAAAEHQLAAILQIEEVLPLREKVFRLTKSSEAFGRLLSNVPPVS